MPYTGSCLSAVERPAVTVVVQIDLFVDSTEAQAVSNDKGVHIVILRQVVVRKEASSLKKQTRLSP